MNTAAPIEKHLGIRFATAPRFGAPVDVDGAATGSHGPRAPQTASALDQMLGGTPLPMAEDCLHLDVFTPGCDDAARPVMVWIHGGAFITGTGAMPWYDGSTLARHGDVVVVTINYRLGALGFLGGDNFGMADQVSALRWVARNIAAFGGDPDDVTIFGESAGGASVVALLATPAADDLFHKAWAMSPSLPQLRSLDDAETARSAYLDLLGLPDAATYDDLAELDVDVLLEAQTRMPVSGIGLKNFSPTSGTDTIPEPILDAAAADPRPLVLGTNRDEMLLFTAFDPRRSNWSDDDVEREFGHRFADPTAAIAGYAAHRPGSTASQLVSALQTDEMFRVPAQRLASARADATWMYVFDYPSTAFGGVLGSCHGLDIPFAFDNVEQQGASTFLGAEQESSAGARQAVADQFSGALLAFVRDADPGWAGYDTACRSTQRIGIDAEVVHDPEQDIRLLWA